MSDELEVVVRGLEAERHRRSIWWRHVDIAPNRDIAAELDRIRDLAASTEPTISTTQGAELLTCIKETQDAVIHRHAHRGPNGCYARADGLSTPPPTEPVDSALDGPDLLKDNCESNLDQGAE